MKLNCFALTMKFFADTRPRRFAAFVVPKAWRFAPGSSAANACLLDKREPHSGAAKNSPATTRQAPAESHARPSTEAGCSEDDADGIKESSLNARDDGWRILPKVYSAADPINPGPALPGAALRTASQHVISEHRRAHGFALPMLGPPGRVRRASLALAPP